MPELMVLSVSILVLVLVIAITIAIARWIFRINDIIKRLDSIINALKVGLDMEEIKKKKT